MEEIDEMQELPNYYTSNHLVNYEIVANEKNESKLES